jgi:hypothetical protein
VGSQNNVEDHGVGTVIVPVLQATSAIR